MACPFKTDTHDNKLMVALIPGLRKCTAQELLFPYRIVEELPTIRLEPMVNASQGRFLLSARRVFRHNGQFEGSKLGGGVLLLESVP